MQESTANGLNFTTLRCMYYIFTYYSVYHMCVIFCAVLNKIHSFIHYIALSDATVSCDYRDHNPSSISHYIHTT